MKLHISVTAFLLAAGVVIAAPALAQTKKAAPKAESKAESAAPADDDQASWGLDFSMGGLLGPIGGIGNAVALPSWESPFAATTPNPAPPASVSIDRFGYLGLRYRLSDSMWFRGGVSFGFANDGNEGKFGNTEESTYDSSFQLGLEPGVEMELARRGRVSAVAGGFLPIGFARNAEGYEGKVGATTATQDLVASSFWVGVAPMVGAQIDIIDGFTVGAEYRMLLAYATKSVTVENKVLNTTNTTEGSGGAFMFSPAVFGILASFRF
jgi:hypothetical protein